MQPHELPSNEPLRLSALYDYGLLDSDQESVFDELTELAASICDVPIALITLVDESRQWFKARVGLDTQETTRSVAFCTHAILQPDMFIVPDALQDPRFADNPLVTGAPYIRFYAGAPLFSPEGYGLGTLCVIDTKPRVLTEKQLTSLAILRTHVLKLFELRRVTRELELSNRELDTYNTTVSNDLRAPLRAMMGFSQLLLDEHAVELNAEAKDLLKRIDSSAIKLDQHCIDLAALSRISQQNLQYRRINLSHLAEELIAKLKNTEPMRNVEVVIHPHLIAMGDSELLRIVIDNLLDNAWKFTTKCEQARIEFTKESDNDGVTFIVRDNGVGFKMAYASKLFQPFQKIHLNSEYPGHGIGLAIVKRIIDRHGGTIRADSTINEGTTIRFTLPSAHQLE